MEEVKLDRDKWFELLAEQEKSALSINEFCRQRNLKTYMLYYYRQELKKKELPVTKAKKSSQINLMPIQIKPSVPAEQSLSKIKFIARNGLQCVLSGDLSIMRIKQIVEVLMSC